MNKRSTDWKENLINLFQRTILNCIFFFVKQITVHEEK